MMLSLPLEPEPRLPKPLPPRKPTRPPSPKPHPPPDARRRMEIRARSGGGGDHLAKKRGGTAEFLEHRPYSPGDDLRRIDWLAFARTGEPVFKLFRSEEDVVVRLLLDSSASLDMGEPNKLETAKRLAAAIGYMALASSERTQVLAASEGLSHVSEPTRGRAALHKLLRELE